MKAHSEGARMAGKVTCLHGRHTSSRGGDVLQISHTKTLFIEDGAPEEINLGTGKPSYYYPKPIFINAPVFFEQPTLLGGQIDVESLK